MSKNATKQKWLGAACLLEEQSSLPWERTLIVIVVLVCLGFLKWASITPVEELVVTTGELHPETKIVSVQAGITGIVQEIYVNDGSIVKLDEPLVKFQVEDTLEEVRRYDIQKRGLHTQLEFVERELAARTKLSEQGLFPALNLLQLQAKRMEILNRVEELDEASSFRFSSSQYSLIRAPIAGQVQEMRIPHKLASIRAGEVLMDIVPEEANLFAELKIKPSDIGHISVGQPVTLRVTTYDPARYGVVTGKITHLSPATLVGRDGFSYFKGNVVIDQQHVTSLATHKTSPLKTGMMVDAEIKTGSKTILDYLLRPLLYLAQGALHER
jgi:multidrug efflux pump subunit AcrA (membrane-fusion protein)